MKTYRKYTEITPREALLALAENDGKPVDGFALADPDSDYAPQKLMGVTSREPRFEGEDCYFRKCARVEEVNPRDVPEGCTPFPGHMPWLAYVPMELRKDFPINPAIYYISRSHDDCWCNDEGDGWDMEADASLHHYAIDVRTGFAAKEYPQIVEAMEYEEADPFEEWFENYAGCQGSWQGHLRQAWDAAIAWKESQRDNT